MRYGDKVRLKSEASTPTRRLIAGLTAGALVFVQFVAPAAVAQQKIITDPNAPIQFRPNVGSSGNGTPQVDITAPSSGGISHNKFKNYDIDTRGVILNNSQTPGLSVIGGQVNANPNLIGSKPANVILNEVTGSTASTLAGPTEVFGQRANVIVANPNGVGCVGCTFINTGTVTLSSGVPVPNYAAGTVQFNVTGGTVSVSGAGLNAAIGQTLSGVDLVGRQIVVSSPIVTGGAARLVAGAGSFDQASGTLTSSGLTVAGLAGPAILSTTAGTIRADAVSVLSTDLNIGVALNGNIQALSGKTTITSAGDAILKTAEAATDLIITANGAVSILGVQQAGGLFSVSGRDLTFSSDAGITGLAGISLQAANTLTSDATFESGGNLSIVTGGTLTLRNGALVANGSVGLWSAADIVTLNLGVYGRNIAANANGTTTLNQSYFGSQGTLTLAGTNLVLGPQTAFNAPTGNAITLSAASTFTNSTYLDFTQQANLNVAFGQNLVNSATGVIIDDALSLTLAGSLTNAGLIYGKSSATLHAGSLTNDTGGVIYSPLVTLGIAGALVNNGQILANRTLTIAASSLTNGTTGQIASNDTLAVTVGQVLNNAGTLQAATSITLTAPTLLNQASGTILSPSITIRGGTLANAGSINGLGLLDIALTGDAVNSGSLSAGQVLALQAANFANTATGHVIAPQIFVGTSGLALNNGRIVARDTLQVVAGAISNAGSAGQQATLSASEIVLRTGSALDNAAYASIVATAPASTSSVTKSVLDIGAGAFSNEGTISSQGNIAIGSWTDSSSGSLVVVSPLTVATNSGTITAAGTVAVNSGYFGNAGAISGNAVSIVATATDAANPVLINTGTIRTTGIATSVSDPSGTLYLEALNGALSNSGALGASQQVAINTLAFSNTAIGALTGPGVVLNVSNAATNAGAITGTNYVQIVANSLVNTGTATQGATISAPQLIVQTASSLTNGSYGTLAATSGMSLSTASLTNAGTVTAGNLFIGGVTDPQGHVTTPLQTVVNSGSIAVAGTVSVTTGYFANTGAITGNAVSIVATAIDPVNPVLINAGTIRTTGIATSVSDPSGTLYLEALNGALSNSGTLLASQQLALNTSAFTNTASGTLTAPGVVLNVTNVATNAGAITGTNYVQIVANSLVNSGGSASIQGDLVALKTTGDTQNLSGALIQATTGMSLQAANLTNSASILSPGQIDVAVGNALNNSGRLEAANVLTVTAASVLNQAGGSLKGSDIGLTAGSIENEGSMTAGGVLQLTVTNGIVNTGSLSAHDVTSTSATFVNAATGSVATANGLYLTTTGASSNAGSLSAGGTLQIVSSVFTNAGSATQAASVSGGTVIVSTSGAFANKAYASIAATSDMSVQSASLTNDGALSSGQRLFLTSTGTLTNSGQATAGTTLVLSATDVVNQASGTLSGADVALTAATLSNAGFLTATGSGTSGIVQLALTGSLANTGTIAANTTVASNMASLSNVGTIRAPGTWLAVTGDATNAGTIQGSTSLQLTANTFGNQSGASLAGGTVVVQTTGALTNATQATISATTALSLSAATLGNAGTILSNGQLFMSGTNGIANSGLIQAYGPATLQAASGLVLNSGQISATDLAIQAQALNNSGTISGSGIVQIALVSDSTNSGAIAAGNQLSIAVSQGGFTNTASGLVTAPQVWIDAKTAVVNNGILYGSSYLQVTATDIVNRGPSANAPAVMKGATTVLQASRSLDAGTNSYIEGTNTLSITAPSVNGNSALLSSQSVSTGLLVYNGNLYVTVTNDPVALPANVSVSGDFVLNTTGDLTNTGGTISAGGNLGLKTTNGSITNTGGGTFSSGKSLSLNASGSITNDSSTIGAGQDLAMVAGTSIQNIQTGNWIYNGPGTAYFDKPTATISAGASIFGQAASFLNHDSLISAGGGFTFSGTTFANISDAYQTQIKTYPTSLSGFQFGLAANCILCGTSYQNDTVSLQATSSSAGLFIPQNTTYSGYVVNVSIGAFWPTQTFPLVYNSSQQSYWWFGQLPPDSLIAASADPSQGGALYFIERSLLTAPPPPPPGGFSMGNVTYVAPVTLYDLSCVSQSTGCAQSNLTPTIITQNINAPSTITSNGAFQVSLAGAFTNSGTITASGVSVTGGTIQNVVPFNGFPTPGTFTPPTSINLASYYTPGSTGSSVNSSGAQAAVNAQIAAATARVGTAGTTTAAVRDLGRPGLQALGPHIVVDHLAPTSAPTPTTSTNAGLVQGAPSQPAVPTPQVTTGAITYLHASPTPTGSTSVDPNTALLNAAHISGPVTFFTDPVATAALVQQATVQQTGRQYLDTSYKSPSQQADALTQATIAFLQANPNVQLGAQLTRDQLASITTPILWYQTQTIDGKDVLVPQLILPQGGTYTAQAGSISSSGDLTLIASGDVTNQGYLTSGGTLGISGASITNQRPITLSPSVLGPLQTLQDGAVISGANTVLVAQNNLINVGGTIAASDQLKLASLHGDIVNQAGQNDFVSTFTKVSCGLFDCDTHVVNSLGHTYEPGQILSGGSVQIYAPDGAIKTIGSNIAASAGVTLTGDTLVKQDVLSNVTTSGYVSCDIFGCDGSRLQQTIAQQSNIVSSSGDVTIDVKNGDFVDRGSTISATNGTISISAQNVEFQTAVQEMINHAYSSSMSLTGISSTSSTWNSFQVEQPALFADNIDITASGDVTGTGAQIAAANDLTIKAGGNIDFEALQLNYFKEVSGWSVGFSFPGSALIQAAQSGSGTALMNTVPLLAAVNGIKNGGFNAIPAALRVANMLSSPDALAQGLDPTGGLLSGGGLSFGVSFSSFESRSDWQQTLASSLQAGGNLKLVSGNDLTLSGTTASGNTTDVTVGGNLTIASVQDHSSSSSSSSGFSLGIGPMGPSFGISGSSSSSQGAWTNTLGTISSRNGTNVTVGGNTNLVGGAITSAQGQVNLSTGTLTASNLNDSQTSQSSSFGITIGANPSFSLGMQSATKLGITSSVVGPGTITLTSPNADRSVLATLSRDPSGRQIVTVDTSDGFSVSLSAQDFQNLASLAGTADSFLQALTAPAPGDVSAQGPAAETVYRQFIATGATQEQADAAVQTEQVQTAIQQQEITSTYNGTPPQQALDVAGTGATVVQPDGMPQTMTVPASLIPSADGVTLPDGSAPPANPADTLQVANGAGVDGTTTVGICPSTGGCAQMAVALGNPAGDVPSGVTLVAGASVTWGDLAQQSANNMAVVGTAGIVATGTTVAAECAAGGSCAVLGGPTVAAGGLATLGAMGIAGLQPYAAAGANWTADQISAAWNNVSSAVGTWMSSSSNSPPATPPPGNNYFESSDPTPGAPEPSPSCPSCIIATAGIALAYGVSTVGNPGLPPPVLSPIDQNTQADPVPVDPSTPGAVQSTDGNYYANQAQADRADDAFNDANAAPVYQTVRGTTGDWNAFANNPQPNTIYQFENGYTYTTDSQGRVANVQAQLEYDPWARNGYQQGQAANCGNVGDCGGHLIASIFGGPGEAINLVPMDATLNGSSGAWYQLEQSWLNALGEGKAVQVDIAPTYSGANARPDSFTVNYSINGILFTQNISNTPTGK